MVVLLKFEIATYPCWKVWDEIIYPFPNFNGSAVEVWDCYLSMLESMGWNYLSIPKLQWQCCWSLRLLLIHAGKYGMKLFIHSQTSMAVLLKFEIATYPCWKVWDEIIYPFPNFNGSAVEVWDCYLSMLESMGWNYLSIPKLQWQCCWSLRLLLIHAGKYGMKLFIHFQTSMVVLLKCGNG